MLAELEEVAVGKNEKILSAQEAAVELGVDPRTVARWCERGEFPGAYKSNPRLKNSPWKIPVKAIEDFLAERRQ